ncbi:MAG: bifunctional riboflavin kinase/FAD synthetase [Microcoleus sp.]
MWVTSSCTAAVTPTALALGNFDGLHLGHRKVVQPILNRSILQNSGAVSVSGSDWQSPRGGGEVLARAREANSENNSAQSPAIAQVSNFNLALTKAEANNVTDGRSDAMDSCCSTVVTFDPHPQEFFTGQQRQLLTPLAEKVELLAAMGVEQLVLLPFDRELAALSAAEFVEEILVKQLQASRISVGMDFRFGKGRTGTAADLQAIANSYGIDVTLVGLHTCGEGDRISSSIIRESLASGDLRRANQLLGRPYSLLGQVVSGQQLGRTIGFPTANIQLPPEKFLPRFGVYAVRVLVRDLDCTMQERNSPKRWDVPATPICDKTSDLQFINGVMNVGCRPTVDGKQPTVEVHLLDWCGDLYGQTLSVSLIEFLRTEQKFASLDALKTQIQADCDVAQRVLAISN